MAYFVLLRITKQFSFNLKLTIYVSVGSHLTPAVTSLSSLSSASVDFRELKLSLLLAFFSLNATYLRCRYQAHEMNWCMVPALPSVSPHVLSRELLKGCPWNVLLRSKLKVLCWLVCSGLQVWMKLESKRIDFL